jgi:FkbM family methyltransferase
MDLSGETQELDHVEIGGISLAYRKHDIGGSHYLGRGHHEEYHSAFYGLLGEAIHPAHCIDVGANYGYTGLLMRRAFPDCKLTLVEPIPWLEAFIRHNFHRNAMAFDQLHSAIVSVATPQGVSSFGVNTRSSQDSRVIAQPGWTVVETGVVTLDGLTADVTADQGVYIKIDTQGWEERVFESGRGLLQSHDRWFIKTEFAPMWLESQGTDPVALLRSLVERYDVHESPGRQRWNCRSLAEAVGTRLAAGEEAEFVSYVRNLAGRDLGWVDLYVMPPAHRRSYSA